MSEHRLVLVGGGGHARVVLDAARSSGWTIEGFVDRDTTARELDDARLLGDDSALADLRQRGATHAVVGVGSIAPGSLRDDLFAKIEAAGLEPAIIIHRSAIVSDRVHIYHGAVVLAGAIINTGASIGRNVIVNTGAIVEHDCRVSDGVHLSPRAVLGGNVTIGPGAHVGIGATVRQGIVIGAGATVAAGAVVVADVAERTTVMGVPARPLGRA